MTFIEIIIYGGLILASLLLILLIVIFAHLTVKDIKELNEEGIHLNEEESE